MRNYFEALEQEVWDTIPVTFHIKTVNDPEFLKFKECYYRTEEENKNKKAAQKEAKRKAAAEKKAEQEQESPNGSPEKGQKKEEEKKEDKEPTYYTSPLPPRNIWIIKPGENTN